jgi:hypothetical protein
MKMGPESTVSTQVVFMSLPHLGIDGNEVTWRIEPPPSAADKNGWRSSKWNRKWARANPEMASEGGAQIVLVPQVVASFA